MANVLELVTINSNKQVPCREGSMCSNGPYHSPNKPKCSECRLSPPNVGIVGYPHHYWKSVNKHWKHKDLENEKRNAKLTKANQKRQAQKAKDPNHQARLRKAERAERETERRIIKATKNSGRSLRDGDHVYNNSICLDTKQQSNAENPVVHLEQLDKVRRDAKRSNKIAGGLVIRNKNGRGIVVFDEMDLPNITKEKTTDGI